jgi:hypothetical protein
MSDDRWREGEPSPEDVQFWGTWLLAMCLAILLLCVEAVLPITTR